VIVLPEQAVTRTDAEELAAATGALVVAGIHGGDGARRNASLVCDPYGARDAGVTSHVQPKHHRWCLDAGQIRRYGLSAQLDLGSTHQYWEDIELGPRALRVNALDRELTYAVLVCEDLARQDAVAEMLREVGPSLVIALLLDGPQLRGRWPARYAGSLAEDPGSSVLTLTSYGMAQLSRPPSPAVALFGDGATGEIVELSVAPGAVGLLVTLGRHARSEHTCDGRTARRDALRLESVLDVHDRPRRAGPRATPPAAPKRLHADSAAAVEAARGPAAIDPREASALYLWARLKHLPAPGDAAGRQLLRETERKLRAGLESPFARGVARALDGRKDVSREALSHAQSLRARMTS
jgi:hypothetical protein